MVPVLPRAASTVSRRRFLSLAAGGALAVVAVGRPTGAAARAPLAASAATPAFLDAGVVHDIAVTFDPGAYAAMVETYADTGDKEWIEATVAIDGATYPRTGLRLKGNSSLMGLRLAGGGGADRPARVAGPGGDLSAAEPQGLPWLVRLDKYADDQRHGGIAELVIRSNPTATALNEAVALDLLAEAGLASQRAAPTAFRVNGGTPALRLAVEHPDDAWMAANFSADGLLYKAEASGDWTYRGDDPAAYDDVFDLEAGGAGDDAADMAPLAAFLDFLNNSDDAAFAAELPTRLDVDRFAVYLAMMDLVANFDDIDGPGNNAYLYHDSTTRRFTVVPWDMNLAFVGMDAGVTRDFPGSGRVPGGSDPSLAPAPLGPGTPTAVDVLPTDERVGPGGPVVVGAHRPHPLVERFTAVAAFAALVDEHTARLRADLYDSGTAAAVLARRAGVLESGASAMVDQATIASEAAAVAEHFARTL